MKYQGFTIAKRGDNFIVLRPDGKQLFQEIAANIKTAKKWIDAHLIERRNLQAEYLRVQGAIDFNG